MQVAEFLSDLTSLQVCDPKAALGLVSARPEKAADVDEATEDSDMDLQRAKDLLALHGTVKVAHQDGTDKDLNEARNAVNKVMREL